MIKLKTNKSSGITLIALVVTIIVLLILAGISIQMLTGDNGILTRAADSKVKSERSQIIEEARIDILAEMTDNKEDKITEQQLKKVLNVYFNEQEVTDLEIPEDVSTLTDKLTSKNGNYKIAVNEIYNGRLKKTQSKTITFYLYNNGDYVAYTTTEGNTWYKWAMETKDNESLEWYSYYYSCSMQQKIIEFYNDNPYNQIRVEYGDEYWELTASGTGTQSVNDEIKEYEYYMESWYEV